MEKQQVLSKLQNLCSKRECCSSDIFKKAFTELEGDREGAEEILKSLIDDKFVDDRRYAEAFAREKSHLTGWGPIKISYMLSGKGISKQIISEALSEIDQQRADSKLEKLLEAKYKTVKGEVDEKFRLIKSALTRGYEYEDVAKAVDDLLKREKLKEQEGDEQ